MKAKNHGMITDLFLSSLSISLCKMAPVRLVFRTFFFRDASRWIFLWFYKYDFMTSAIFFKGIPPPQKKWYLICIRSRVRVSRHLARIFLLSRFCVIALKEGGIHPIFEFFPRMFLFVLRCRISWREIVCKQMFLFLAKKKVNILFFRSDERPF